MPFPGLRVGTGKTKTLRSGHTANQSHAGQPSTPNSNSLEALDLPPRSTAEATVKNGQHSPERTEDFHINHAPTRGVDQPALYGPPIHEDQVPRGLLPYATSQRDVPSQGLHPPGPPSYGPVPHGQLPFGQTPYGQMPYRPLPYEQMPYCQAPPYDSYRSGLYGGSVPYHQNPILPTCMAQYRPGASGASGAVTQTNPARSMPAVSPHTSLSQQPEISPRIRVPITSYRVPTPNPLVPVINRGMGLPVVGQYTVSGPKRTSASNRQVSTAINGSGILGTTLHNRHKVKSWRSEVAQCTSPTEPTATNNGQNTAERHKSVEVINLDSNDPGEIEETPPAPSRLSAPKSRHQTGSSMDSTARLERRLFNALESDLRSLGSQEPVADTRSENQPASHRESAPGAGESASAGTASGDTDIAGKRKREDKEDGVEERSLKSSKGEDPIVDDQD